MHRACTDFLFQWPVKLTRQRAHRSSSWELRGLQLCLPVGLKDSIRDKDWSSAKRQQLSELEAAWNNSCWYQRRFERPPGHQPEQKKQGGGECDRNCLGCRAAHGNQRRQVLNAAAGWMCFSKCFADAARQVAPFRGKRAIVSKAHFSVASVITLLLVIRPHKKSGLPSVLHLETASDDAACIDKFKTLAEIINSHAERVIRRKATQRRTWAAREKGPSHAKLETPAAGARVATPTLGV